MYGTSAGMLGGFCSGDWPCVEGECDGGTCKTPSKKGSNEVPGYVIAMIVVMCVLLLGLAVFLYFYRKKMKVKSCVEIKILRRVCAESSRRPPRHRRDACSMAWRCRFLAARQIQRGHAIAEKCAPDALVDFHTEQHPCSGPIKLKQRRLSASRAILAHIGRPALPDTLA